MSITERQEKILKLLEESHFLTVEELSKITFTSPSSIRRDLTYLQNNGLAKRIHGGVTSPEPSLGVASFQKRLSQNVTAKKAIAKKAASLIQEGQSILLDGSSTVSFLLPYIAKHNFITLFTNNISTALNAITLGIDTHCIGGHSVNGSAVLSGTEAYKTITSIRADLLFFSSQSLDINGVISDSTEEENYLRSLMICAAEKSVFLCDSEKFGKRSLYTLTTLNEIDCAVFDQSWQDLTCNCNLI